jgi:inner membrane protein
VDQGSNQAMGVGFRQFVPVSHYTQLNRAVKYAKLFIVLTFIFCFFAEVRSGFQIHFINYLLAGSALLMFFVLLLSFSEHVGFEVAYLIASSAIIIQLSIFLRKVLQKSIPAKWSPVFIAGLYGFLYSILRSEDYALLTGSLGLFIILSVVMFISSKMNWSQDHEKV